MNATWEGADHHNVANRKWYIRFPYFYWGAVAVFAGLTVYILFLPISLIRLVVPGVLPVEPLAHSWHWAGGAPVLLGAALIALDLALLLPHRRRLSRRQPAPLPSSRAVTVVLTAYNDEASVGAAVRDFLQQKDVRRVIVVSNNSTDNTEREAALAGAIVYNETRQGYGACVYRCLKEALQYEDTDLIVLCEGDMTFRADDLDKFFAYIRHADIVNGTRIVEQLRELNTQLSTFMYYGNFFAGKLLEVKHLGKGTFTDVGTTYKMIRRGTLQQLLPHLDPAVNLEFNAHFLDVALERGYMVVECPVTFHPRVGVSKGGNRSNLRALWVGSRMIFGLSFGWRRLRAGRDSAA